MNSFERAAFELNTRCCGDDAMLKYCPPNQTTTLNVCCLALKQIAAGPVSVRDLAVAMSKKAREVTKMLRQMGETNVSPEFMVDPDTAELVALEFGLRTKRLKLRNG